LIEDHSNTIAGQLYSNNDVVNIIQLFIFAANFSNMKKIFFLLFCLSFSNFGMSQRELSSFSAAGSGIATAFLSDYQCLGINPANLGWKRNPYAFHFSLLETGVSIYSDAMKKKNIKQDILFNKETHFTAQEKITAAEEFANSKFAINADVAWLSFAYQNDKFGGIAFTVRERATFSSYFNKDFAQVVFEGYNAPYFDSLVENGTDTSGYATAPKSLGALANGSKVAGTWYREYVLGYGRKFFANEKIAFYAGADVKYLAGYGILNVKSENSQLSGFSALSPFLEVNYASSTPSQIAGTAMNTVGSGFGFDVGATLELFQKLRIGAALNDIGSINWDGNVYEAQDTIVNGTNNPGFYSFDMINEMKGLIQDSTIMTWKGLEKRTIALPSNFRLGINYKLSERSSIGMDCYVPVNNNAGSFDKAIIGIGGSFGLFDFLTLSAGFATGGNSGFAIPVGLVFSMKDSKWEMGIASRDAITFFGQDNPTVSAAFGFLRFNVGKVK